MTRNIEKEHKAPLLLKIRLRIVSTFSLLEVVLMLKYFSFQSNIKVTKKWQLQLRFLSLTWMVLYYTLH
jgi:hypothetical protein